MISHEKKIIFIHIRKNAGSFFYSALKEKNSFFSDGLLGRDWVFRSSYPEYITVAIVRNPWDRFVSGWRYCRSTRRRSLKEVLKNLPSDKPMQQFLVEWPDTTVGKITLFEELVYRGFFEFIWRRAKGLPDRFKPLLHDFRHITCQQTDFIMDSGGKLVVDYVIRFESLEYDLKKFINHLGRSMEVIDDCAPVNRNANRIDYREVFDSEDRRIFEELFERDVGLLGYTFDKGPGVPPDSPHGQWMPQ